MTDLRPYRLTLSCSDPDDEVEAYHKVTREGDVVCIFSATIYDMVPRPGEFAAALVDSLFGGSVGGDRAADEWGDMAPEMLAFVAAAQKVMARWEERDKQDKATND